MLTEIRNRQKRKSVRGLPMLKMVVAFFRDGAVEPAAPMFKDASGCLPVVTIQSPTSPSKLSPARPLEPGNLTPSINPAKTLEHGPEVLTQLNERRNRRPVNPDCARYRCLRGSTPSARFSETATRPQLCRRGFSPGERGAARFSRASGENAQPLRS